MGWIIVIFAVLIIWLIVQAVTIQNIKWELEGYSQGLRKSDNERINELERKVTGLECLLKEATTLLVGDAPPGVFSPFCPKAVRIGLKTIFDILQSNASRAFSRVQEQEAHHLLLCKYLKVKLSDTPASKEYVKEGSK
jgi:hypothetical protein